MDHSTGTEWWRPIAARGSVSTGAAAVPGQDSAVPFGALMVFTFILLLSPQTFIPGLAQVRIALLTGAFAVAAHCWTRSLARRSLLRFTREVWLATALLAWAVVTIPLSEWPGGSVQILLDLYLKALIIFWLLSNVVTTLGRLRTVAWGLSLMAVPLASTAVWNFLSHRAVAGRIVGYNAPLVENPNDLALLLNLIVPLTGALFFISRRPAVRGLLAGLLILDVSAIVVTFSRGGLLTLLASLFLFLRTLLRRREWKWAVLAVVLAVAAVPLLPHGYVDRATTITNINADPTGSAQVRWQDMRIALAFLVDHPLAGAGLGMNILALNELRGPRWQPVHNVYLEYGVDLGWLGLGLFLLLLTSCVRSAARVHDHSAGVPALWELSVLAEAIRITLVAFAVAALFHPVAYHFYFYYLAALAVAVGAIYEAEVRTDSGILAAAPARRR